MSQRAIQAITSAQVVAGYRTYLELVAGILRPDQERIGTAMMQEVERCREALHQAARGRSVALVCGGDPGVYAMAGLIFELARARGCEVPIEIIPGISAVNACAALLGAPLMHDFATISLSDLLTPWNVIEKRLRHAAEADFVIALYNPASRKRRMQLGRARDIVMEYRPPETPAGIVTSAYRKDQAILLTTLDSLTGHGRHVNMQSTVIIGNSRTFTWNGLMVTPRGYGDKYRLS